MYGYFEFKNEVAETIFSVLKEAFDIGEILPLDESPPQGDLAVACFPLAKPLKKSPAKIAKELAEKLPEGQWYGEAKAEGPYINFYIDTGKIVESTLKTVLEMKDDFGQLDGREEKLILEHTSANPTDRLHVGRARNPILGDTLARIMRKAGHELETQYYVDDMGRQAAILTYGMKHFESQPYQQANEQMEKNPEVKEKIMEFLHGMERGEKNSLEESGKACATVMEKIKDDLTRLNITLDSYVNESRFVLDGSVNKVIEGLEKSEYFDKEPDGAKYIEMKSFGVKGKSTKFFFLRSNGTSLYATRDVAYHIWKFTQAESLINILGEDHKLESKQIASALEILGHEKKPEVVFYSFVALPEGKMSTRKGQVVFIADLIDEGKERALEEIKKRRGDISKSEMAKIAEAVAVGAVRYNIINVQAEKRIVFKWEDALNFEGCSAPFIQYSHARAASILRKDDDGYAGYDTKCLKEESEMRLIKTLAQFPWYIDVCARGKSPHLMAAYAYEAAVQFNQFYRDCPVLDAPNDVKRARLALTDAAKQVIRNALDCLGIEAPEKM